MYSQYNIHLNDIAVDIVLEKTIPLRMRFMKRFQRLYLIVVTGLIGVLGLTGPSMLQGAGGPEAALILQVGGVLVLLITARLVWLEIQSRR